MTRFLAVFLILSTACVSAAETTLPQSDTSPAPITTSATSTTERTPTTIPEWDTSRPFAGFSLSPLSFEDADFTEFLETASSYGDLVAWVGPWQDLDQGGSLVYQLSFQHAYVPVAVTGFPTDSEGRRIVPEDPTEMIDTIATWVADHRVPYLGVGVEINVFLRENAPEDFDRFVEIFPRIVAAVHEASPETSVFPIFQLERLRGLRGGLYGGEDTDPEWELLSLFPDADAIGFTTYPGLIYTNPVDIPSDYYIEIFQHTDMPIVFTEVGWQAGGDFGGWSGSPDKQADFMALRVSELAVLSDMLVWSFLWDQEAGANPFSTMGLFDREGRERPAWEIWQKSLG